MPPASPSSEERAFSIVVPASTANVGCAFDCAAIALNVYLRASAAPSNSGLQVSYRGANEAEIPRDATNLVVRAMQRAAEAMQGSVPAVQLDLQNDIPLGVGLGSSAAAIVAGILLGGKICGRELTTAEALRLATEIEGHPDNVAAALHGGFVLAATQEDSGNILVAKANVSQALDFIAIIPDVPLPTEKARAVLPAQYSRCDVVANLQRTALLATRFFTAGELSPDLFADRLHQPYRAPLVPGIAECLSFRHPGLAGIFLSGAGSAVMAIARHSGREITDALVAEFQRKGTGAHALSLRADNSGAKIFSGDLGAAKAASHPKPQH
ncbi:MAG TPA: homoserine kinase [Candidatus Acidoferrales bacterium]|nr:homoserine kinase [Candidatus Acidoferrales bacterium]